MKTYKIEYLDLCKIYELMIYINQNAKKHNDEEYEAITERYIKEIDMMLKNIRNDCLYDICVKLKEES